MRLELFPEQKAVVDAISEAFRAGHRRVMVSAACGFGKTELATAVLRATLDNGRRGGFIADRISLCCQTSERFDKYDLPHGVIQGDHPRWRPSLPIQVISAQTVGRRMWPELNLIVVDEAHVLSEPIKKKLLENDCFAIGLSATAITKGLGKYFDVVVNAPPTNRLIESGRLVPLRIFSCVEPDMEGVKVNGMGEFEEKETESRVLKVVGDVVAEYLKHGNNKKFIGFAASIAHAQELQRQFLSAGINVATYTADDKPEDRSDIVQEFRKPNSKIRGILSVEALTRGFDVADVELLIMARPLRKAVAVFVQMLGRVMRSSEGKTEAVVLDHSGNSARFWDQWNDLFENGVRELDDGKPKPKKKEAERPEAGPVKCPGCRALHKPAPACPVCGHQYPRKRSIEHVPGTLKELIAGGHRKQLTNTLWPMVAGYAADVKGDNDAGRRMAMAIYKEMTGDWPMSKWELTRRVSPSAEVMQKIRAQQIRFRYRKAGVGVAA